MTSERRRAWIALGLLVPAPTLGALAAFIVAPGPIGQAVYALCKLWILALPLVWQFGLERGRLSLSPLARDVRARALGEGLVLGALFVGAVLAANALVGERWLDPHALREVLLRAGLTTPGRYLGIALYIALANSLLEEIVWRWFVFRQIERIVGPRLGVPLAALGFTLHHALVFAVELGPELAVAGSIAVFVAGCLWSWLYARWRSIWPGWLCHALVDAAGLWIGWQLLF
jgi:CAAX protease family protein